MKHKKTTNLRLLQNCETRSLIKIVLEDKKLRLLQFIMRSNLINKTYFDTFETF